MPRVWHGIIALSTNRKNLLWYTIPATSSLYRNITIDDICVSKNHRWMDLLCDTESCMLFTNPEIDRQKSCDIFPHLPCLSGRILIAYIAYDIICYSAPQFRPEGMVGGWTRFPHNLENISEPFFFLSASPKTIVNFLKVAKRIFSRSLTA